jgi:LEA14-like dessication related protein
MEMNSKSSSFVIIGLVIAALIAAFLWFRTNTQKLVKMAEYELKSIKVGKVGLLKTVIKASILIKNPSDMAITLKSFRVEILRLKGAEKLVLATSPTSSLVLPSNGNIVYDIDFNINNLEIIDLVAGAIKEGIESQLKGKISVRIKADFMDQYIEKEIPLV